MRRILLLPVLLSALAVGAGCTGGTAEKAQPAQSAGDANPLLHFAQCMRDHGVNMPDPDPDTNSYSITAPAGTTNAAFQAAQQACRQYLPDGGVPQAPTSAELAALRQYAQCMRAHGIETSDPDPNTGKSQVQGRLANATREQLNNDPAYQAALQACKGKLPKGDE